MLSILNGDSICVIATIMTTNASNVIVARGDRGIAAFADLKGKRIAATLGTTSDFFLNTILLTRGLTVKDAQVVDLSAEEIPDALAHGDIDAAAVFLPYSIFAQDKLGKNAVVFRDRDIYRYSFNIVARREYVRKHPGTVTHMLKALLKAEEFVEEDPAAAQKIVATFTGMEPQVLRSVLADIRFAVTLDETLVLALEDESEWAIRNHLAKAATVPNYLDYIYLDGLKSLRPDSVSILRQ